MDKGYATATSGQVIEMAAGTYGADQSIAYIAGRTSTDDVTFRPASGATVNVPSSISINARHITIRDINVTQSAGLASIKLLNDGASGTMKAKDITLRHVDFGNLYIQATDDVAVYDSDIGPSGIHCPSCTLGQALGAEDTIDVYWAGPTSGARSGAENVSENVLFEGNYIHDAVCTHGVCSGSGSHSDGIQIATGGFVTLRRNKFQRANDQNLIKGDQGPLDNIVLENNWFDAPGNSVTGETTSGYSLQIAGGTACTSCVVRNNTFNDNVRIDATASSGTVTGNLIEFESTTDCNASTAAGFTWAYNAFGVGSTACGTNTFTFTGAWASAFVDSAPTSATLDLHLTAGAEALGKGSPGDHPVADIDSDVRPSTPDAGADER